MTKKIVATSFDKVVMIALLLSPILSSYGWGSINFAFIVTLSLAFIHILLSGFRCFRMPQWMAIYLLFWYFSHLFSNEFPNSIFPLGIIRIFLTFKMFYDCFEFSFFIKKYRLLCSIFVAFFFIQTIVRCTTGTVLPGVFSFLPIKFDEATGFVEGLSSSERDSSFFSEPAHFVQFLLPLLSVELFYFKKRSWLRIVTIVVTLLLLQSGNALLGLVILGIAFIVDYYRGKWTAKRALRMGAIMAISSIVGYLYINSSMGERLLAKQDTVNSNSVETRGYINSGFVRIYRGYFIYQDYSIIDKIKGNDSPLHIEKVALHSPYSWAFNDDFYFNTFQSFLVYSGIIGTMFFAMFFISQWRKTCYCGRTILAVFFALAFISSMHFHEIMAIYMLIPFALRRMAYKTNDRGIVYVKGNL